MANLIVFDGRIGWMCSFFSLCFVPNPTAFIDKLCRRQIKVLDFAYTITMYEVTISIPNAQSYLLEHISHDVSPYFAKVGGTFVTLTQRQRSYFSVACKDTFKPQAKRLITQTIAQVLSLGYKNIYVRNLLDVQPNNFYQSVLVDTMCAFDYQFDASKIATIINCDKDVFVDGYYNFRLASFKAKWESIAGMILQHDYILLDNDLIVEFLQYLLQSVEHKAPCLAIVFNKDGYNLYDANSKVLPTLPTLSADNMPEVQAIVNAVCINPQQLKVYYLSKPSQDFCDLATALFDVQFVPVQ